jgi:hypothetical protein
MKNNILAAVCLICGVLGAASANATELNIRQNISNGSMNKVASARLQGIFASAPKTQVEENRQFGRRGCVTEVGSRSSGSSLLGQPKDIVINGDITNVCF